MSGVLQSCPSEFSGLHVEGGGLSNVGHRRELGLKDAPHSCACSIPARRTRSLPHQELCKGRVEGSSARFLSCPQQEIAHPARCSCPFSFQQEKEEPALGGEIQRTAEQTPARSTAPLCRWPWAPPGPSGSYSCSCHTHRKGLCAHVRASWEIPVEASQS